MATIPIDERRIAVVILNWNGRKYLSQFLPVVVACTPAETEIVVADNGSTDDSLQFLAENFPGVKTIVLDSNYGFAGGYNRALRKVDSDYYVLLNSDVEVTPGWLDPMLRLMEKNKSIAACQPKILSYAHRDQFEYAGAAGGWIDSYGYPFSKGRVFDVCERDRGQYDQEEAVFWASGACLFLRSIAFSRVGGFDEYFFAHQEEIDLCWRLQLAGHQVYSCPSSVVYHVGGGTLPKGRSLKTYLNFRNNRIMMSKNLPWQKKIWLMPARNFLDVLSAWKGLLTGDAGYFFTVLRAQAGFLKWWLFKRKQSVFPAQKEGSPSGIFRGNIVWQYFVKKRRTFSQIAHKTS